MKMNLAKTGKHIKIKNSSSQTVLMVAIASVIVVFCAMSVKALIVQGAYQRRVVNAKNDTVQQLRDNIESAQKLSKQYEVFESANPNVLGASSQVADNAPRPEGKNSRIVLDALPTQYDFPALISSLSKVLNMNAVSSASVGGADQGSAASTKPSANPKPVSIDQIPVAGTTTYSGAQSLIRDFERSIRPFDITSMQITGNDAQMTLTLNINTYYQPATVVQLEKKEVK